MMILKLRNFVALIFLTWLSSTCWAVTPEIMLKSRENLEKFHQDRLSKAVKNTQNISRECTQALVYLETSNNTALLELYVDAMGKPGGGIKYGDTTWLGSYSECKAIPGASYCLAGIEPKPKNGSHTLPKSPFSPVFKLGLCVPKQCSEVDIAIGLKDIIKAFGLESSIELSETSKTKSVNCAKPSKYTGGVIATLTLCGVLLFLCLCGTIIEIAESYTSHVPIQKPNGFMPISNGSAQEEQDSFTAKTSTESLIGTPRYSNHAAERPVVYQNVSQSSSAKQFFLSFSLLQNTTQILNTKVPPNAITSINGMRVLSIFWVILGHTFAFAIANVSNLGVIRNVLQRFSFQVILSGVFAVDSFFFLSGLLVAYLSFRQMDKAKGSLNLFKFYFHRFWRLTPVYMFVLLFYDQLTGFLGEGPLWYQLQAKQPCDDYWWTNLLYINNFYPTDLSKSCMGWAWYLANDMQFFIISPVVIFAAYRFGKRGLGLSVGSLLAAGFISTAVIVDYYQLGSTILDMNKGKGNANYFQYVYVKPYCRIAPYLVGMALGYILHMIKDRPSKNHSWWFILIGWCVAIVLALSTVFGTYKTTRKNNPEPFTTTENVFYATFSRFAWSLALAWVIYACHTGYGGLVDKILSARFWIPLSRLTYCVYLVHLVVLSVYISSTQTLFYYSDANFSWIFIACTTVSYFVAYIVSVACEVPMMQLEKLIFKTDRKRH